METRKLLKAQTVQRKCKKETKSYNNKTKI